MLTEAYVQSQDKPCCNHENLVLVETKSSPNQSSNHSLTRALH